MKTAIKSILLALTVTLAATARAQQASTVWQTVSTNPTDGATNMLAGGSFTWRNAPSHTNEVLIGVSASASAANAYHWWLTNAPAPGFSGRGLVQPNGYYFSLALPFITSGQSAGWATTTISNVAVGVILYGSVQFPDGGLLSSLVQLVTTNYSAIRLTNDLAFGYLITTISNDALEFRGAQRDFQGHVTDGSDGIHNPVFIAQLKIPNNAHGYMFGPDTGNMGAPTMLWLSTQGALNPGNPTDPGYMDTYLGTLQPNGLGSFGTKGMFWRIFNVATEAMQFNPDASITFESPVTNNAPVYFNFPLVASGGLYNNSSVSNFFQVLGAGDQWIVGDLFVGTTNADLSRQSGPPFFVSYAQNTFYLRSEFVGSVTMDKGIIYDNSANGPSGHVKLVNGGAVVANTSVDAQTSIQLTSQTFGTGSGTPCILSMTPNVGFVITNTSSTATNDVAYLLFHYKP